MQIHIACTLEILATHGFRSFGLMIRFTSANFLVFFAFPIFYMRRKLNSMRLRAY